MTVFFRNAWRFKSIRYQSTKSALLFPGQGAQYVGMGSDIYSKYPSSKSIIDTADALLPNVHLKSLMFSGPATDLTQTPNAQPAIVCHSIGLLKALEQQRGFKIQECEMALGHSLGEYSALVATQSLKLEDAIRLVRLRGQAMQMSVQGIQQTVMKALIVVKDHLDDVQKIMRKVQDMLPPAEVAEIANINSRSQVVLSGTVKGVEYAASIIHSKGYSGRSLPLPVSAPFHCSLMAPAMDAMAPALQNASFSEPIIPVISNVTGDPIQSPSEIGQLLTRQIAETVQWHQSLEYAKSKGVNEWIVVGPSKVLGNLLKKEYPDDKVTSVSSAADIEAFVK